MPPLSLSCAARGLVRRFREAGALDREHAGVPMSLSLRLTPAALEIKVLPDKSRGFEQWALQSKGELFNRVYGLAIVLQ